MPNIISFENKALSEAYYKTVHSSGLTVYVYPKARSTSYVMLTAKYGSLEREFRLEGEKDFMRVPDGVAHFLEHKLFEEEDGSDAFEKFAPLGASANAFTSFDMTSYLFSTTDRLEEALSVLLSFVTHPHFTQENVKKEQGIIAQEIGMCDDEPWNRLYYSFLECLYREHNVRVNIAGTVQTISEITPDILYRCYRTFYQLSNMALVVSGNISMEAVMKTVDSVIPDKAPTKRIICRYPEETAEINCPYTELKMAIATPLFAFGVKDIEEFSTPADRIKRGVLLEMIGKACFSRSAPFYNKLYTEGLLTKDIGYAFEAPNSCAYFIVTGESKKPIEIYERTKLLLQNLSDNIPSEEDFLRIKRAMYASHIRTFDSTESLAMALTDTFINGTDPILEGELIASLTYADFCAFAAEYFKDKEFVLSVIYPSEETSADDGKEN